MLLGEPPPTQGDLHFRILGFPVRVHPFFWVSTLLLGMGGGEADPVETLIWIGVVFISILVHELGHAVMQRRYGGRPWVTLYGLGGLAVPFVGIKAIDLQRLRPLSTGADHHFLGWARSWIFAGFIGDYVGAAFRSLCRCCHCK